MEQLIESIASAMSGIPGELVAFIISLCPILELRGGLIAASMFGVDLWVAIPICIIGNILPIPFILLFIEKIFAWLKDTRFVKLINKLEEKAEKNAHKIMKHKKLGLFLFVAIPLPGNRRVDGRARRSAVQIQAQGRDDKHFPWCPGRNGYHEHHQLWNSRNGEVLRGRLKDTKHTMGQPALVVPF